GLKKAGDVVQTPFVDGHAAGSALWECKTGRPWGEAFVATLEKDMLARGAVLGVIVTDKLPSDKFKVQKKRRVFVIKPDAAKAFALIISMHPGELCERGEASDSNRAAASLWRYIQSPGFKKTLSDYAGESEALRVLQADLRSKIARHCERAEAIADRIDART